MKEEQNFYIVDKSVLPEVFLKVMEVKKEKKRLEMCDET